MAYNAAMRAGTSPGRRRWASSSSSPAAATVSNWPISTPRLKVSKATSRWLSGRPISLSAPAKPRPCLVALLGELSVAADEVVVAPAAASWPPRFAAYRLARGRFIDLGRGVQPAADVRQMLAQVREPLLSVLRSSPDFRPAYDPLLRMAGALARIDAPAGQALLTELMQLQPARPEAAAALRAATAAAPP